MDADADVDVDVDVPGKFDMKRPEVMATLHFLALEDILESIGERALHGTGRRWNVLTTNSVASSQERKFFVYGTCRHLAENPYYQKEI